MSATTFEVDGVMFEVTRLDVDATCEGLELLAKVLGPILGAEGEVNWLTAVMGQASLIPKLLRTFAPVTKVSRCPDGRFERSGGLVPLKPFLNDAFAGRQARMLGFLVKACQHEYGSFLDDASALQSLLPVQPPAKA